MARNNKNKGPLAKKVMKVAKREAKKEVRKEENQLAHVRRPNTAQLHSRDPYTHKQGPSNMGFPTGPVNRPKYGAQGTLV